MRARVHTHLGVPSKDPAELVSDPPGEVLREEIASGPDTSVCLRCSFLGILTQIEALGFTEFSYLPCRASACSIDRPVPSRAGRQHTTTRLLIRQRRLSRAAMTGPGRVAIGAGREPREAHGP